MQYCFEGARMKSTSHDEDSIGKGLERYQDDSTRRSFQEKTKQFESLKGLDIHTCCGIRSMTWEEH